MSRNLYTNFSYLRKLYIICNIQEWNTLYAEAQVKDLAKHSGIPFYEAVQEMVDICLEYQYDQVKETNININSLGADGLAMLYNYQ